MRGMDEKKGRRVTGPELMICPMEESLITICRIV
jgi:hypothetical protein